MGFNLAFNPLNAELNQICHLLSLLGAHHIFHVSGLRVKSVHKTTSYVQTCCLVGEGGHIKFDHLVFG